MRISTTLFILYLITACFGEDRNSQRNARAPQGHIQYSNADGNKVNWKFYAPYTQWKTHLEKPQRSQKAEANAARPAQQSRLIKTQPTMTDEPQTQYRPYSMLPDNIKQLIYQMYQPQLPYVDPSVYIYQTSLGAPSENDQANEDQYQTQYSQTSKIQIDQDKTSKKGHIQYKEDNQSKYNLVSASSQQVDNTMPAKIQQLLYLQAQTPYHVIANRIFYQPKSIFVPKPIPLDEKNPYKYHTKVYYLKDGTIEPEDTTKSIRENLGSY